MATVEQQIISRAGFLNISQAFPSRGDISKVSILKAFPSRGNITFTLITQKKSRACVGNDVERRLTSRGNMSIPVTASLYSRVRIFDSVYGALFL